MADEPENKPKQRRPRKLCVHCRGTGMMEVINMDRSKETRPCRYCEAGVRRRTPQSCGHCQGTGLMQLYKTDGSSEPYPCLYCAAGMDLQSTREGRMST
jgi:DnaJ-class molecular chaperone